MLRDVVTRTVSLFIVVGCQSDVPQLFTREEIGRQSMQTIGVDFTDGSTTGNQVVSRRSKEYSAAEFTKLPIGAMCTVELLATGRMLTGRISKVSDEILVLADTEELVVGSAQHGMPLLQKIPYTSRLFKNTSIGADWRFLGPETISASEVNSIIVELPIHDGLPQTFSDSGLAEW